MKPSLQPKPLEPTSTRKSYQTPRLETEKAFVMLTGVSVPFKGSIPNQQAGEA